MKRMYGALLMLALSAPLVMLGTPNQARAGEIRPNFDSIVDLDVAAGLVTLPMFVGKHDGEDVYYIILDASDRDVAEQELGVNFAPIMANALGTAAVQKVNVRNGVVRFKGTVDFSPERVVVPNPTTAFPPDVAIPGSVGDADYSPLITTGDGVVINAPQIANSSGVHDSVFSLDFANMQATVKLVDAFYENNPIVYISTDASIRLAATLEESTYAPNLNAAPGLADPNRERSSRAALIAVVNGATGVGNSNRQGFQSAVMGQGDPLNVTAGFTNNRRGKGVSYSPLWDLHLVVWTDEAIAAGQRELIGDSDDVADLLEDGLITSGGMGPPNNGRLGGLRAADFIVNCPVIGM